MTSESTGIRGSGLHNEPGFVLVYYSPAPQGWVSRDVGISGSGSVTFLVRRAPRTAFGLLQTASHPVPADSRHSDEEERAEPNEVVAKEPDAP